MKDEINVMFLGDNGQLWLANNYVEYLLEEKELLGILDKVDKENKK